MTTVKVVEPVPAALDASFRGARRMKKEKYTLTSLPFPRGATSTTYIREWRRHFKSTLIHWAATLKDPFGTNGSTSMEDIVTDIWKAVFPSIADEVLGSSRQAIIYLVSSFFYSNCKLISSVLGRRCPYRLA